MAGAERVYAAEHRGEYDVPVQAVVRGRLWARGLATQRTEAVVKCAVLNRMTRLGMPQTVRVF